jgi:hypothetical protein
VDLGRFFSFLIYTQSVELPERGISQSQGRYLHTEQHKQNKRTQISMPRVGFEPTIPVFERTKTVHALGRAATVVSQLEAYRYVNQDWTYEGARANDGLSESEMIHGLKRRSWYAYEEWKDWVCGIDTGGGGHVSNALEVNKIARF